MSALKTKSGMERSSLGPLYWFVFACGVVTFGVIFVNKISEFVEYTDSVEEDIAKYVAYQESDVLGTSVVEITGEETTAVASEDADQDSEPSANEVAEIVDEIEEERKDALRKKLLLQLPEETDNPNQPVTFVEPTDNGVEIQVNGEGFKKESSPYTLPSLAIGKHTINFKFEDEDEVTQNLEETIIVIPRAPVWDETQKKSFRSDESVVLSGTAVPRSDVVVLVSSEFVTDEVESDENGEWSITLSEDLDTGEHSAVVFTRKDGYASGFSEPLAFTVGPVSAQADDDTDGTGSSQSASSNEISNIFDKYVNEDNYVTLLIGAGVVFFSIIVLVTLFGKIVGPDHSDDPIVKTAEKDAPLGSVSLREKFAKAGIKVEKEEKKETDKTDEEGDTDDKDEKEDERDEDIHEDEKAGDKDSDEKDKEDEEEKDDDGNDDENDEKKEEDAEEEKPLKKTTESVKPEIKKKSDTKKKIEDKTKKPPKSKEKKKIFSKDEFLKEFKEVAAGEPKGNNRIKISLTSGDKKS